MNTRHIYYHMLYSQYVTLALVIHFKVVIVIAAGTSIQLYGSYLSSYHETNPVHMSNVQCSGTEPRLIDCPHSSGGGGSGGLWSDATLSCYPYSSGNLFMLNSTHYGIDEV